MSDQDIYLSPLENQWRERLTRAEAWVAEHKAEWQENIELYNGKRKHLENRQYEYYANIIYQIYKTDKSQVCPLGLDFYAESDGMDRGAQENMLVSALLNNQLATFENVKKTRKLHTQVSCKGVGVACISVDSYEKNEALEINGKEEYVTKSKDRITLTIKNTEEVLYDKDLTDDYDNLPWVAVAYTVTAQRFRESMDFQNKSDVLQINGIDLESAFNQGTLYTNINKQGAVDGGYKDPRFAGIKIWEVWDVLDRKKIHIEAKSFKIVLEEGYPTDCPEFNYPFEFLSFTDEDVDKFPPMAEISYLKEAQEAFNKIRSAQVRDVKRGVRHLTYNQRAYRPSDIAKITDADKDQAIPYDDQPLGSTTGPVPPQNLLFQLPDMQPMPDAHPMAMGILGDIQQTSGYGPMERAGLPQAGTATETNAIAGFMADRRRAKLYEILNFWHRVAKKALILIAETFPEKIIVNSSRWGQPAVWKELKKNILTNHQYNIKVYVGTEGITDRQRRVAEDLQVANMLFPIAQAVGADLSMLLRKILALKEWTPDEIDMLFKGLHEKAKALAVMSKQFSEGQNDEVAAMKFKGAVDDFLMNYLTPEDLAELQGKFKQSGGQAPESKAVPSVAGQRETMMPTDMGKGVTQ